MKSILENGANAQNETPLVQMIDLAEMNENEVKNETDAANGGASVMKNINPLHSIKTRLQVFVGELEISVGELLAAKEHQVLTLNSDFNDPVDLVLEGHVVARGKLVAVDGHFAIKITELPIALKP